MSVPYHVPCNHAQVVRLNCPGLHTFPDNHGSQTCVEDLSLNFEYKLKIIIGTL